MRRSPELRSVWLAPSTRTMAPVPPAAFGSATSSVPAASIATPEGSRSSPCAESAHGAGPAGGGVMRTLSIAVSSWVPVPSTQSPRSASSVRPAITAANSAAVGGNRSTAQPASQLNRVRTSATDSDVHAAAG